MYHYRILHPNCIQQFMNTRFWPIILMFDLFTRHIIIRNYTCIGHVDNNYYIISRKYLNLTFWKWRTMVKLYNQVKKHWKTLKSLLKKLTWENSTTGQKCFERVLSLRKINFQPWVKYRRFFFCIFVTPLHAIQCIYVAITSRGKEFHTSVSLNSVNRLSREKNTENLQIIH